ncbi:MAG: hypothetical protein A2X23_12360 [Chloroflexi bacterium GWC2_73_18]|nr:MAG: hypothetical protein A2X23_12360 [Chloroflexi bacterium GWC2_73_18]
MPTYERTDRFQRDHRGLSPVQRARFRRAVGRFVVDLAGGTFRDGLRVKRVDGTGGIFEMTSAPDGRATFQYGKSRGKGPHVIWRRIGSHDIFGEP